jgi:LacI family transcriptional regulator
MTLEKSGLTLQLERLEARGLNGRRSSGRVTIQDVARMARVSTMTVSRVINDGPNVRESTRSRVREVIEKLSYAPNTAAQQLAGAPALRIGLLHCNPSMAYLGDFLLGSLRSARKFSCHLIVEGCDENDELSHSDAVRRLADAGASGVILPPPLSESVSMLTWLQDLRIPFVTIAAGKHGAGDYNCRIDDFSAAKTMTEHILALGHRRIGFIKGHPSQAATYERLFGFQSAIQSSGLDINDMLLNRANSPFTREDERPRRCWVGRIDPPPSLLAMTTWQLLLSESLMSVAWPFPLTSA